MKALLRGDSFRAPSLAYSLDAWHVGIIACGVGAEGRIAGYAYAGPYRARPGYRYTVENSVYVAPWARR